jgi:hypothetical protein
VDARIRAGWVVCVGGVILTRLGNRWMLELAGSIPLGAFGLALAANVGGLADRAVAAQAARGVRSARALRERVRLQGALACCVGLVSAASALAHGLGLGSSVLFR